MLSRRLACFRQNMDILCARRRTYLWTFTMPVLRSYDDMRDDWKRCLRFLREALPEWSGIRVYEVHPGRWNVMSHGLHVHIVSNKFHNIHLVRDAAQRAGFGRIHVVRRRHSMGYYLAKYLSKARPDCLKGWRLWSCFNMPERIRLSDIYMDSMRSGLYRLGYQTGAFQDLGWADKCAYVAHWVWQKIAGQKLTLPVRRWKPHFARVERAASFAGGKRWKVPPLRFEARELPFPFHRRSPAPVAGPRPVFASAWGGEDLLLADLRRNAAFQRSQVLNPF